MRTLFILCGGPGAEHDVSLKSGENVYQAALLTSCPVVKVLINKDGTWNIDGSILSEVEGLTYIKNHKGLAIPLVHGTYGEDGTLHKLFGKYEIDYIGSLSEVMRTTFDKYLTQEMLQIEGVRVPETVTFDGGHTAPFLVPFAFPVVVKPRCEGSSISLYKVHSQEELNRVLVKEIPVHSEMLVQECITGREFTCGVLEMNGKLIALPPTEVILTKGELFDYEAKYTVGGCREVTPPEASTETIERVQALALQVHDVCGCEDISRTDMMLTESGELVVFEINTIPGMTETSFIPAQLKAAGHTITDFITSMILKYEN